MQGYSQYMNDVVTRVHTIIVSSKFLLHLCNRIDKYEIFAEDAKNLQRWRCFVELSS